MLESGLGTITSQKNVHPCFEKGLNTSVVVWSVVKVWARVNTFRMPHFPMVNTCAMYIYIYMYIYLSLHMYIYIFLYIHVLTYIYIYINTYIIDIYIHIYLFPVGYSLRGFRWPLTVCSLCLDAQTWIRVRSSTRTTYT